MRSTHTAGGAVVVVVVVGLGGGEVVGGVGLEGGLEVVVVRRGELVVVVGGVGE